MDSEPDYSEQWRDLRRRRFVAGLWFFGYVPGVAAIFAAAYFLISLIGLARAWIDGAFYVIAGRA